MDARPFNLAAWTGLASKYPTSQGGKLRGKKIQLLVFQYITSNVVQIRNCKQYEKKINQLLLGTLFVGLDRIDRVTTVS